MRFICHNQQTKTKVSRGLEQSDELLLMLVASSCRQSVDLLCQATLVYLSVLPYHWRVIRLYVTVDVCTFRHLLDAPSVGRCQCWWLHGYLMTVVCSRVLCCLFCIRFMQQSHLGDDDNNDVSFFLPQITVVC